MLLKPDPIESDIEAYLTSHQQKTVLRFVTCGSVDAGQSSLIRRLLDDSGLEQAFLSVDVAYRFFSTDRRRFIVAETPGDEKYTRNMVAAASTKDLVVILVHAGKG